MLSLVDQNDGASDTQQDQCQEEHRAQHFLFPHQHSDDMDVDNSKTKLPKRSSSTIKRPPKTKPKPASRPKSSIVLLSSSPSETSSPFVMAKEQESDVLTADTGVKKV